MGKVGNRGASVNQPSLFGPPPSEPPRSSVAPAPVPEELEAVAASMPAGVRLGTSSWSFPGWSGLVYDRSISKSRLARHGLEAYARHPLLRTVGIDRTYYAPIDAGEFSRYAAAVPEEFRFLVKASGECTFPSRRDPGGRPVARNELFLDAAYATGEVVGPFVEGLGAKAGPLLFQFPPMFRELEAAAHGGESEGSVASRFAERLAGFLDALPRGPMYTVELRDRALFGTDYLQALSHAGARHCLSVHPRMPAVERQRQFCEPHLRGPVVVRWMLHSGLKYEEARQRYDPFSELVDEDLPSRRAIADLCVRQAGEGHEVFVVANNKAEGSAPLTVFELARLVAERQAEGGCVG